MTTKHRFLILLVTIVSHLAVLPIAVFSQTPFYQGKTLKIVNNDPGGTAGMRVKAVVPYLRKYIPGNPTIIVEFIEGGGGRRAATGIRIGAQEVGAVAYTSGRLFAYFLDLKAPKFVTGYSSLEADVALMNAEIDSRANNTTSVLRRNREWVEKGVMNFHAILEVPKGDKHPHPVFAQLPEIESFAKTDKEKKLLAMWRGFRTATSPYVLPPGTPKDRVEILQEAMRKVLKDPEFRAEFKKLVTDDVSPLMPEELLKVIKETPRDAEVIEMLKKFTGVELLPPR